MKIAIGADLHLHNWKNFSDIDPTTGLNTRLLDGIKALENVWDYCNYQEIKHFLFAGDLFERGHSLAPDVVSTVMREFREFSLCDIDVLMVSGNHDQARQGGLIHALSIFEEWATILDEDGGFVIDDKVKIIGVPYRPSVIEQQKLLKSIKSPKSIWLKMLLGHFFVAEIMEELKLPIMGDYIRLKDLPKGFDYYFLGHLHEYCRVDNVISIGSMIQQNFGDVGKEVGFLVFDTDTRKIKRVKEIACPRFVDVSYDESWSSVKENLRKEDFHRVFVKSNSDIEKWRTSYPDYQATFQFLREEKEEELRIEMDYQDDPRDIIDQYSEYAWDEKKSLNNIKKIGEGIWEQTYE